MERTHEALEVVMSWGGTPQRGELFDGKHRVMVGEDPAADFVLPREIVPESFALVDTEGGEPTLCIPAGATARMTRREADGRALPVDLASVPSDAKGRRRVPITHGSSAVIDIGELTFYVRSTDAKVEVPRTIGIDWRSHRWIGASFAFHAVLIGILFLQPPDAGALSIDIDRGDLSQMRYYMASVEREQELVEDTFLAGEPGAATNEGRPMDGDEGAAGNPDERRNTGGRVAVRGDDVERRVPLRARDVRQMQTFGTLAAAAVGISDLRSPYGSTEARGWAAEDFYGPLMASSEGWGPGNGGWGMIGTGRGGCPPGATSCGAGTVGSGDFDTIGTVGGCSREDFARFERRYGRAGAMDRCNGSGQRVGDSTGLRRGDGVAPPRITFVDTQTVGGLSREQVRRVVRRNLAQVRHCYEQGLTSRPDLEGRVSIAFVIGQSGAVGSAQVVSDDLGDGRVAPCIQQAVRRWGFPQSPGVTAVTYPFQLTTP